MGTGLGDGCRQVDAFGELVRQQVGEGTCSATNLPASLGMAGRCAAERGRVLVVDDEKGIRSAITRLLGREHEVVCAASGIEGQALLERDQGFDLIYFDLMMPERSGIELFEWLTEQNPNLASQVVFITGGAYTPRAEQFLTSVENLRVEKPFDVASFKQMAGELVQAARAKRGE